MEITNCEQYVLNKLQETENEVERLRAELVMMQSQLKEAQDIITTYDEVFREHGTNDLFDSSNHVSLTICDKYETDYYNFLMERNHTFLTVKDYRDVKLASEEVTE